MEKKVLLLALYKHSDLPFIEVVKMLENSKLFTLKEGKRLLRELKNEELAGSGALTPKGIVLAKTIEGEFRL